MTDHFIYTKIQPGKVRIDSPEPLDAELLGVHSDTPGMFHVKAKGNQPEVGLALILPLKGAKQISLKVEVESVEPLITPIGGWSARCNGPEFAQFDIKHAQITCDGCGEKTELEFVDANDDTQNNALKAMVLSGWQATAEQQICPKCKEAK